MGQCLHLNEYLPLSCFSRFYRNESNVTQSRVSCQPFNSGVIRLSDIINHMKRLVSVRMKTRSLTITINLLTFTCAEHVLLTGCNIVNPETFQFFFLEVWKHKSSPPAQFVFLSNFGNLSLHLLNSVRVLNLLESNRH